MNFNFPTRRIISPPCSLRRPTHHHAFTLIETLVYMSMLFIILGLGYAAMYRSMDASAGLRRDASDITQALDAGERWRQDVRDATQPIRLEHGDNQQILLRIPRADTEVIYRFESNNVTRRVGQGEWAPALEHVNVSNFIPNPREKVTAWKWEVELQSYRKSPTRLKPLFTFIAVPTRTPEK